MYSDITYSGFDVLRELGMRILHRLVQEIVRIKNLVERGRANVGVEAVYDALDELGVPRTIDLADGDNLPPCPSRRTIIRGRGEGSQRVDGRQGVIDALHHSYARRAEEAAARAPALGGDRGAERRMLIDMYADTPPSTCLFLPDKYFSQLTRWVFTGIAGHAPSLSTGARHLIQFTVVIYHILLGQKISLIF